MSKVGRARRSPELRILLRAARIQKQEFQRAMREKMKLDALKEAIEKVTPEQLEALGAKVSETTDSSGSPT